MWRIRKQWPYLTLCLLGLALLLPGTGTLPLMDRDEPRFAQATREMVRSGDWVVPTFNQAFRFDKPPLTYWAMAPWLRGLGDHEGGARAHSILATILLALLVFRFAGDLGIGRSAAWAASAAMMASVQFLAHGRSAVADMPMVLSVTLAQYAAYRLMCGEEAPAADRRWRGLLCLALVAGFLAKGPVAAMTTGLALVLFRWVFVRRPLPWRRLGLWWVVPLALVAVALWGVPALWRTQGDFWRQGIGFHVVERGMRRFHGRLFVPIYYPITAFLSLFPWSMAFGRVFQSVRRHGWRTDRQGFLLAWLLSPMILFLPYATQLPHYALPGFPAFFLLLGWSWTAAMPAARRSDGLQRGLRVIGTIVGLTPIALLFVLPSEPGLRLAAAGAGLMVLSLTGLPARGGDFRMARLGVAVVVLGVGMQAFAGGMRQLHVGVRLADRLHRMPPETRCLAWRYGEPSLVYYSGRHWTWVPADPSVALPELRGALRSADPVCVVALEREVRLSRLLRLLLPARGRSGAPAIPWRTDSTVAIERLANGRRTHTVEGFSPARGVWVRLTWIASDGLSAVLDEAERTDSLHSRPAPLDGVRIPGVGGFVHSAETLHGKTTGFGVP